MQATVARGLAEVRRRQSFFMFDTWCIALALLQMGYIFKNWRQLADFRQNTVAQKKRFVLVKRRDHKHSGCMMHEGARKPLGRSSNSAMHGQSIFHVWFGSAHVSRGPFELGFLYIARSKR